MNRGKIFNYKTDKNFKVKYGTVDNKEIKSVFINFTSWLSPIEKNKDNYNSTISKLKKNLKREIFNNLNFETFSKNLIIVDLDIRESGLRNSSQTFMSLDVSLYQKKNLTFKDEELEFEMRRIIKKIHKILKDYKEFEYYKRKRKI